MSNSLTYGRIYMFETSLSLRYRIFVPVIFKDVDLPDDLLEAKRQIRMKTKLPMINKINRRTAIWDRNLDEMSMILRGGKPSDIPFDVLMYSLRGVDDYQVFTSHLTFNNVDSVRECIVDYIDESYDGKIYPVGLSHSPFIIKTSTLESNDLNEIRNEIQTYFYNGNINQ